MPFNFTEATNTDNNDIETLNRPLRQLDAAIRAQGVTVAALQLNNAASVFAQINNGSGEADTSWIVDNISGTFLAGATVAYVVAGVVYTSTVAANTATTPLTVTVSPAVTLSDNTVIAMVPPGLAGLLLENTINYLDPLYGGIGDGVTDDSTALQTAIDAATASGRNVLIPAGATAFLGALVTLEDGVEIVGQGYTSEIKTDGLGSAALIASSVDNIGLRNLRITGDGAVNLVLLEGCSNVRITDCWFHQDGGTANVSCITARYDSVGAGNHDNYWITGNHFTPASVGVLFQGLNTGPEAFHNLHVNFNTIDGSNASAAAGTATGIKLDKQIYDFEVIGNAIDGASGNLTHGINVQEGAYNGTIAHNQIRECDVDIKLEDGQASGVVENVSCNHNQITGIGSGSDVGIQINAAGPVSTTLSANGSGTNTSITVTSITGFSAGQRIAVILDDATQHVTTISGAPSGSTISLTDALPGSGVVATSGNTVKSIHFYGVDISHNIVRGCDAEGVAEFSGSAANLTIKDNIILNCGSSANTDYPLTIRSYEVHCSGNRIAGKQNISGLRIASGGKSVVTGNHIKQGANLSNAGTSTILRNNTGYVTEAAGEATILSGNTEVTVTHGLSFTPASANLTATPTQTLGSASFFWVDTFGSTTFKIKVNTNPGADVRFGWKATRV